MDVIAHNVANVNTNDFKSSSARFTDSFSQTIQNARQAREDSPGTNPMQVGSGVSLGSIEQSTAPGAKVMVNGETETLSNTNIAKEITDMITTQRGFEANTKVIPIADSMMEEIINLKR